MLDENCAASSNRMHIKRTGFDTEVLCVNVQTLISVYICKLILARVFSLHYHPFVCCSTTATWLHALCDMLNPIGGWALGGSPHFYTPRPCPRGGGAGQVVRSLCPVTEVLCVWPRRSRILRLAVTRASPCLAIWGSFSRFDVLLLLGWLYQHFSMPVSTELLASLGCQGSQHQLAQLQQWLVDQEVSSLSELEGVTRLDSLDGELTQSFPLPLFFNLFAAGLERLHPEGVKFLRDCCSGAAFRHRQHSRSPRRGTAQALLVFTSHASVLHPSVFRRKQRPSWHK